MKNKSTWNIIEVMPTLNVTDLKKAVAWYGRLNFETDWYYPSETAATHVGLKAGEVNLMLALCSDSQEQIQKQNLYFIVKDIEEFRDKLPENFDNKLPSLTESDYGMRDFSLQDPWGHLLTFGEYISG